MKDLDYSYYNQNLTWQSRVLRFGTGVPEVPVSRVLLKGSDNAVEVGEFVQLCDVVPRRVCQPCGAWVVHLVLSVQHLHRSRSYVRG